MDTRTPGNVMNREIVTRRNLPHWYMPNAIHFVTFRLAGTIPREALERLQSRRLKLLSKPAPDESRSQHRQRVHKQLFAEYDEYLDANREIHWLDDPSIAALVRRSLYYWHGRKYGLLCWCVMPNHEHVLLQPFGTEAVTQAPAEPGETKDSDSPLAKIMHSVKSYTAHEANKLVGRIGQFWQHESYDHWVRDEEELARIVAYINANPAKSALAEKPHEFPWSSAHDRFLFDGDPSGSLCFDAVEHASLLARNLNRTS